MASFNVRCFLSNKVYQLVCEIGATTVHKEEEVALQKKCLDEKGLLQLNYLQDVVFHGVGKFKVLSSSISRTFKSVNLLGLVGSFSLRNP